MKVKMSEWLMTVGFCAFLGGMAVLYLVLPKNQFSELEKRELAEAPVLTAENLTSGALGSQIDTYMADYMPGRDFFVGVNAYFERLTLRQPSKDIYLAEGNRLVEKPVQMNDSQAEAKMAFIREFADMTETPVDLMIVPSGGWAVQDSIVGIGNPYEDERIISNIYALAGERVFCQDVTSAFAAAGDPASLYYRTDHHWTSLGAYTAYEAYMNALGRPYREQTDFTVETVSDFKGTTHQRSALWLIPGEDVELWTGADNLLVSTEKLQNHPGAFYKERLLQMDKYTVFLDGNHPIVRIENPDADNQETLVVIRDSYSNCLGSFLAQSYRNVVLVDLRYWKGSPAQLCRDENADRVLICYSLSNFMTDTNLVNLTNTPE